MLAGEFSISGFGCSGGSMVATLDCKLAVPGSNPTISQAYSGLPVLIWAVIWEGCPQRRRNTKKASGPLITINKINKNLRDANYCNSPGILLLIYKNRFVFCNDS